MFAFYHEIGASFIEWRNARTTCRIEAQVIV
jgi:hypothetical protein